MSNKEIKAVEKIRSRYTEREITKLDELKELDRSVKRPANIFAYIFGSVGALILGGGMCLAMPEVIEGYMPLGIVIGVIGMAMVGFNYFIYKKLLQSRRDKYSHRIFELSNELLGEESSNN